ncbi:MAG: NAD-dependent epimerase/dehydratase family protein, partial [Candidatus Bathyarchaeia archaeon]
MKVLVLGSNGFVGTNLTRYLRSQGFEIIDVDVSSPASICTDISKKESFFTDLKGVEFDAVVHLAAITKIRDTIEDPYRCYNVNCMGTLNVLELASQRGVKRLIYASSANVYGLPLELPVKESTPFNPRSPYDYSKVIGEYLVQSYHRHKKLPAVILRSWKLFGEHDSPQSAVSTFIKSCLRNKPIPLYNSGRDTTDLYHVENYCHAVELCLTKSEAVGEAFNVGTGNELSIRQIAEIIKDMTGSRSKLQLLPPRSTLESKPMRSYPSIEKIERLLGYSPIVTLEQGLKRTIDFWSQT